MNLVKELVSKLKSNGYVQFKIGTKHDIYSNGRARVMVPRGNNMSPNTYKWALVQMRRGKE